MSAQVIDLDSRRPPEEESGGWRVVKGRCDSCSAEAISVQHEDCPLDNTECPQCPGWKWRVTHFEADGSFIPRLQVVS